MAERSIVEIMLRARGGRAVASETGVATRGVDKLGRTSRTVTRNLTRLGAAGTAAGAALGYGLYRGARKSLEAFAEAEKVGAQTRAVLQSTGHAAGVSQLQIEKYAASLSRVGGVDDEAIQSAENLILTFRDIKGKAFEPTLQAALDMSAAFTAAGKNMSVQDAAMQISKAVNDPIKGMSRLQRIGVTFTRQQIEQATAMQENGDLFGAQRVILRELGKEYGGSFAKQGKTTQGTVDRLGVSIENVQEAIGLGLSPVVSIAADKLDDFAQRAEPALLKVSQEINDIFGRKDIDLAGKLALSARELRTAADPVVDDLIVGLKNAQLDDKLEQAIVWAGPAIADGAAAAAPRAAKAFVNAWMESGPWGKLATAIFVAYKARGVLGGLGRAKGAGGLLGAGRGMTRATPLFVADVTSALPGKGKTPMPVPGGKPGRLAKWGRVGGKVVGRAAVPLALAEPLLFPDDAGNGNLEARNLRMGRQYNAYRERAEAAGQKPQSWTSWRNAAMQGRAPTVNRSTTHVKLVLPNGKVLAETVVKDGGALISNEVARQVVSQREKDRR